MHVAFRDYDIEVNRIIQKDTLSSTALFHENRYKIFCFAEDDWKIQADSASSKSISFASPTGPNKVTLSHVTAVKDVVGVQTTLDDTPPCFTHLSIEEPTAANNKIVVTFTLNEAGTVYCRATRIDTGETAADMPINRIRTANWFATYTDAQCCVSTQTIEMTSIDKTAEFDSVEYSPFLEAYQYDVYCWATDDAVNTFGNARPNYMTQDYVGTSVNQKNTPVGGLTMKVWVQDKTAPTIIYVSGELGRARGRGREHSSSSN